MESSVLGVVGRPNSTRSAAKATRPGAWRRSVSGKAAGEDGWGETESEMSKAGEVDSSLSERPEHHRPRRLADWINPTGARKVHSLIDKVYKRKNLEIAWERVKANHGAGGIDGESIEAFGEGLEERLARLHEELRTDKYIPQPVRQQRIPKAGKPGEWRVLCIPTIYDRVCQQALLNRLEPIFEPIFDDANFGYRRGRSLSNILLTPFDREMRRKGYQLTRYADDWVITCASAAEARAALEAASRVLKELGVTINPQKTRIVHVRHGFEFLGYKIKRGSRPMSLPTSKIKTTTRRGSLYAYPREKSINHFKEQLRRLTRRHAPVSTQELIQQVNPVVRGWGHHYKRAHVRKLFHRLDGWLVRRIWSHRYRKWRCCGWKTLPRSKLYGEYGLVNLIAMIPSIAAQRAASS